MKHFDNLMKYSLNASSSPVIRAEVKDSEVLIYVGSKSLFTTMPLAQYEAMIERDSLTL